MKVILTGNVPVTRFAIFAEMGWIERRPELGHLCRIAPPGGRLDVTLVEKALPGVTRAGAENILRWCASLGLCNDGGTLTALGMDAITSDEAPVPEQGVYDLWTATHPLFGTRIFHAERLVSRRDQRYGAIVPLPVSLEMGRLCVSLVDPSRCFVLRGLPTSHGQSGCVLRDTHAAVRVVWELDLADAPSDRWLLSGTLDVGGKPVPIRHSGESTGIGAHGWHLFAEVAQLHLADRGTWNTRTRRLAVSLQELTALGERAEEACTAHVDLGRITLTGYGQFDAAAVRDLPLAPKSAVDADGWAHRRFMRRLAAKACYRTRADVGRLWRDCIADTPLAAFSPALPAHAELLAAQRNQPGLLWSLAAPVDLSPVEIPAAALGRVPLEQLAHGDGQ